jgi:hypothetical protein
MIKLLQLVHSLKVFITNNPVSLKNKPFLWSATNYLTWHVFLLLKARKEEDMKKLVGIVSGFILMTGAIEASAQKKLSEAAIAYDIVINTSD